jgi:5-methylcytosine-specific restriction endonuclease McrA
LQRGGIFDRDDYRCVYCGERFVADDLTVDHVQARVRGGDHSGGNLVTACRACNTLKGHRRLSEFLHDDPVARTNFARYAVHVWPRLLRALDDELARLDGTRDRIF